MLNRLYLRCAILNMIIMACHTSDNVSNVPSIKLIGISKLSMLQGDLNQDSVLIQIEFEDGDGDLGFGSTSPEKDITVVDQRTGIVADQFKIPDIPSSNGRTIKGDIWLRLYSTCCIFPDHIPPCTSPPQYPIDTIVYEIFIKDKSGNLSNGVFTPPILLRCN